MDDVSPLSVSPSEMGVSGVSLVIFLLIAVASYRRSRCLSRYPVWRSVLIGVTAGSFPLVWIVVSVVNRQQIAAEWGAYRARKTPAEDLSGVRTAA